MHNQRLETMVGNSIWSVHLDSYNTVLASQTNQSI